MYCGTGVVYCGTGVVYCGTGVVHCGTGVVYCGTGVVYCGTGVCIVVLELDVLSNGFLCTGYLCALSCVLFALCCVLLKCAYCCVQFRCRTAG